ncbi:MAG: tRNA (adenosine(37)-N6)-threonylcarbamoyltransferase complex dimerization subunit type 1 TsaB [Firmicutes bacterium HGW-Firmicutes-15]|nr:MAG: tRNA (adenosine(37)-N6)-threonylcarbamoyltransferase complex dimerization subunit type 1 TsaB [Firmicutes bacterium HGW-Firmicutes-15]
MLILAIDSATPVAGIALLDEEKLIREEFINYKKTHSETLMPMVDQLLRDCERSLQDVTALAITIGPGSFTGLRIGLAAIKGLSLAAGIPVVGISTLDVLAHNIAFGDALVCPLLNARKQEVYTAFYDNYNYYPHRLSEEMACSPQEFTYIALEKAQELGKSRIILLGDGYYPYSELFADHLGDKMLVAPSHLMLTRASALGSLALERVIRRDFDEILTMRPRYIRLSEAENKLGRGEL